MRRAWLCAALLLTVAVAEEEDEGLTEAEKEWREKVGSQAYCGAENCYDVLGIAKEANAISIKRAYRRLATEWHPDRNPDPRAKELFQKYANAYEMVGNPEMRKMYDYLHDHPHEYPSYFMRYSQAKYAPKSDLRFVVLFSILAAAAVQYYIKLQAYQQQKEAASKSPQYQQRLKQLIADEAKDVGKSPAKKSGAARGEAHSTKTKRDQPKGDKLEELKSIAEEKLEKELVSLLGKKPRIQDTLLVNIFKAPITLPSMIKSNTTWLIKFKILGQEYGDEEKAYYTRKVAGFDSEEWDAMVEEEQGEWLSLELWVAEKREQYEKELTVEGAKASKSSKEKRSVRMKKKGPSGDVGALMD